MSIKQEVLKKLDEERGKVFSGEELAEQFGVSRNAVWKAIKTLREEGYDIAATTNRGYCLHPKSDILTADGVRSRLSFDCNVHVCKCVDSTNDELKKLAMQGAAEWTVVIAEEQKKGRGRNAHSFYSPAGTGLYISVLFRPKFSSAESLFVTTSAAVAVCEAIEETGGKDAQIKWVNDVFIGGKKVCGILTEASFSVENGGMEYVIAGIGINVKTGAFPKELEGIAASVFGDECPDDARARLAAVLLERLKYYYEGIPRRAFYAEYVRRSFLIGKEVIVDSGRIEGEAVVEGIDEQCFLQVRFRDGTKRSLSSGEVHVRLNG